MTKKILPVYIIALLFSISAQQLIASDDDYDDNDSYNNDYKERVYGWELMTEDELVKHREKIRNFETREERREYRKEHHEKMLERAKKEDVYLRDCPRPEKRSKGAGRS